jgi:TPR repeat protein
LAQSSANAVGGPGGERRFVVACVAVVSPARSLLACLWIGTAACASSRVPAPGPRVVWGPEQLDADRRCQQGSAPACTELGRFLAHSSNAEEIDRGRGLLDTNCRAGDLTACTALGERDANMTGHPEEQSGRLLLISACTRRSGEACTAYGKMLYFRNSQDVEEAAAWLRQGCELGDVEGCDLYGELQEWNLKNPSQAAWAFDKACKTGRRASCNRLGRVLTGIPSRRAAAAEVFADNCARGFSGSCTSGAIAFAPLLSPLGDCRRAAPLAAKTCASRDPWACAISDACKTAPESDGAAAVDRLRSACDRRVAAACFYWADAQGETPAEPEKVRAAYELACRDRSALAGVACPRLAAMQIAGANWPTEVERPLSQLTNACEQSSGEACCALADVYAAGKWVTTDGGRVKALRAKACDLGRVRCCGGAGK